jgi:Leucine rich repeat
MVPESEVSDDTCTSTDFNVFTLPVGLYNSDVQRVRLIARNLKLKSTFYIFHHTTEVLRKIISFDLSRNHLSVVQAFEFSGINNVSNLNLSNNHLTTLQDNAFDGLINLAVLILANNQLLRIPSNSFGRLPKLQTLFLDNNNISTLAACTLTAAKNLTNVDFESNEMQQSCPIDTGVQENFREISIAGNPWNCTYLKEMWSDFKNRGIKILDESNIDEGFCGGLSKKTKRRMDWVLAELAIIGIVLVIELLFIAFVYYYYMS